MTSIAKKDIQNKFYNKKINFMEQTLYNKEIIQFKVLIPFNEIDKNLEGSLINYAKKNIMGKCHKEGYISYDYVKIIQYSSAKIENSNLHFNVFYEFHVFNPHENMEIYCKIQSITKIGVKAVVDENKKNNPIIVFASRMHNEHIFSNMSIDNENDDDMNIKEGDVILVKTLGFRFEINDPNISILGFIIEENRE